jgi:hypothetical protein
LVDGGDKNGVRIVLTEFVGRKSDEAMKACQQMLDFLNALPILEKNNIKSAYQLKNSTITRETILLNGSGCV